MRRNHTRHRPDAARIYTTYDVVYTACTDHPDIGRIIDHMRKLITINLAANDDAEEYVIGRRPSGRRK